MRIKTNWILMQTNLKNTLLRDSWRNLDTDWLFGDLKYEYSIVIMFKKRILILQNKKKTHETLAFAQGT